VRPVQDCKLIIIYIILTVLDLWCAVVGFIWKAFFFLPTMLSDFLSDAMWRPTSGGRLTKIL
jgi:hypothetical protein